MKNDLETTLASMFKPTQQDPQRVLRTVKSRRLVNWQNETRLVGPLLSPLPRPGCVISGLIGSGCGRLDSFVPAFSEILGMRFTLDCATLAISAQAVDEFARLLEEGHISKIRLLLSKFFQSRSPSDCSYVVDRMTRLGQQTAVGQSHCKILLVAPEGQRHRYVVESSANLRSCSCVEQFSLSNDTQLFQFYQNWFNRFFL